MRGMVVGLGLFFALGCAGIAEQIGDMAGVEVDAKMGEDAVHPEDFPLPPPEVGEIAQSTTLTMAGMATDTVQYMLPPDADAEAVLARYETLLRERGHETTRDAEMVQAQVDEQTVITAQLTPLGDEGATLSLVHMRPGAAAE